MNGYVFASAVVIGWMIGVIIGHSVASPSLICAQPHIKDGKAICAVYVNKDMVK